MHKKFIVEGGTILKGEVKLSGAKNVALKALAAALLTKEEVVIENMPDISDLHLMAQIVKSLGSEIEFMHPHHITMQTKTIINTTVDLDMGAHLRTSSMVIGPLLARTGEAIVPNPGGCRIGARPIDRHIEGFKQMGAEIDYNHDDGYYYIKAKKLHGMHYTFEKNSHTGTETLLLGAVRAEGQTILENAAEEPEVDDLISFLNTLGADVKRTKPRRIVINGKKELLGGTFSIMPDRNEAVTYGIAAYLTRGDITVHHIQKEYLTAFFDVLYDAGASWKELSNDAIRFYSDKELYGTNIETKPYPGFMTDWQAPWCLLMTQAAGESIIHETVFESRFGYVEELKKTGANIALFNPDVKNPHETYNFNWSDNRDHYFHAAKITGPTRLHNAILNIADLRAGATLVLASLVPTGKSILHGIEHLDRGYEHLEDRLNALGASIKRIND